MADVQERLHPRGGPGIRGARGRISVLGKVRPATPPLVLRPAQE